MVHRSNQLVIAFLPLPLFSGACSTSADYHKRDTAALIRSDRPAETPGSTDTTVAMVAGEPVTWSDLHTSLAEASGGIILRELALDRMLARECKSRGISISDQQIAAEQELLLTAIERDAALTPERTGPLLERVRRSRGLGDARFRSTLERNARLRALVKDEVEVTGDDIDQAIEIRFGPRYRVRVIVSATQQESADLRARILKNAGTLDVEFARAAAQFSIDPSAERGGLLEPISPADQSYPQSLRAALASLKPGEISPVIAADDRPFIMMLESALPAVPPPENARAAAESEVRRRRERIAMEKLAAILVSRAGVAPIEPSLRWSWDSLQPQR